MKELSLNILDISQNSLTAGADDVEIKIEETSDKLTVTIKDNGSGMDEEKLKNVTNPFFTSRTTRKVGLGIPLFKLAAEQTGGCFEIQSSVSEKSHGTTVKAVFVKTSIDFTPLGDIISTLITLVQSIGNVNLTFIHDSPDFHVELDTKSLKNVLGNVPLDNPEVLVWIKEYLSEQYQGNTNQ